MRALPVRARRGDGGPRADGDTVPRGARGRRRRHARLRDRDRRARADRLVGRDHTRRAHVARDDADLPLRQRGAEAAVDPPTRTRRAPRCLRPHGARGRIRCGRDPNDGDLGDGGWSINGAKAFITNSGTDITQCVTITALTGEGEVSNLVVENGTPGLRDLRAAPQDGLEGVRHARALVHGLRRPRREPSRRRVGRAFTSSSRSSTAAGSRWLR